MITRKSVQKRLLRYIEVDKSTRCWVFVGHWDDEYGRFRVGCTVYQVRRVAAWIYGKLDELWLTHLNVYRTCQTPACCNPRHLGVCEGDWKALMSEAGSLRLQPLRMTTMKMRCIRSRRKAGETLRQIAEDMGVSESALAGQMDRYNKRHGRRKAARRA